MHMGSESRDDIKLDLASEALRSGGTVCLKAWGTSMLPSVWPGDLLTVQSVPHAEIVAGDIILVLRNNRFSIHRLIETQQSRDCVLWITRGDAVPGNDPPAIASELLGRVTAIRRADRCFAPSRKVSHLHRGLSWMLCHWDRLRSVCLRMHAFRQSLDQEA
jgi:signal peptidase I